MSANSSDMRPILLGACAWSAMWLASSGQPVLLAIGGLVATGFAVAAGLKRSWFLAGLTLVVVSCLAAGGVRVWLHESGPLRLAAESRATGVVEVVVAGGGRSFPAKGPRPQMWVGNGRVVGFEARGNTWSGGGAVTIMASGSHANAWSQVPMGTTVRSLVRFAEPDPGEPVAAIARAREPPTLVGEPGTVSAAVHAVRQGLRDASAPLGGDARHLVPALVVGDVSGISDDVDERFKVTALTHVMAVSGSNLVLMLAALRAAAVVLGARGRVLTVILLAGVAAFVAVCLGEPSVVRAAGMGLVGMVALGHGGGANQGRRFLAVAVWLLVLLDPWLARSVGFALSVVASAGLLWWGRAWTEALASWLPRWVAESIAVPLAAQVATEPIIVALAGRVSLVGVLANAVVAPLVGPATVLGFVTALTSVVWLPAAQLVARGAGVFAEGILRVAYLGSELPGAAVSWPTTPLSVLLVAIACLAGSVVIPQLLRKRQLVALVAIAWVALLLRTPTPPGWPPPGWSVVACDVGQGDATVFNAGSGTAVVVDAGPDPGALDACLAQLRVTAVPLVFLTHLHADHVTGLPAISDRNPDAVVTSGVTTPQSGDSLVQAVPATRHVAGENQVWTVGEVSVTVLAVPDPPAASTLEESESSAENDASLLLRVTVGGVTTLVAGDSEDTGQSQLAALGDALVADVLLVPHHGSSRQDRGFHERASPSVALVSVGEGNGYGHPTERTLRLVADLGATVARTDESGSVAVGRSADGRLLVTTQR